ncbi:hypothetical protein VP01_1838g2 [Puccinia sorghi]|uniref:Uncharacterized protein n=1 Tax=Puccinia sorghi TaxID=27349 RepID=A0A0L6VDW0_9BASI|nr:hypothetical protein VP01_1838g2 [Puccinia sorghi]
MAPDELDDQYLSNLCENKLYKINGISQPSSGKIIQHIPTTMYSDNTSGNVSKQWNKHISLYL